MIVNTIKMTTILIKSELLKKKLPDGFIPAGLTGRSQSPAGLFLTWASQHFGLYSSVRVPY